MKYSEEFDRWLCSSKVDEATKAQLRSYSDEQKKLYFHGSLQFGTAGLRGVMSAGTNAMNVYTVAQATQGFANLINSEKRAGDGVAIACDSRNNSQFFSTRAAEVLAGNGIKVYIFESLRPTPVLSFAVRHFRCAGGINITASHNPKQYNGYKAYWDDGAQLSPAQASLTSSYIEKTDIFDGIKSVPFDEGVKSGLIRLVGKETDEAYLDCVLRQAINPRCVDSLKVVYTPLNGAGHILVPEALRRLGVKQIFSVPSQNTPDGEFPTTPFPNPEYKDVFKPGIKIADEVGSDLIVATDPDADRMGIAVRSKSGEFVTLTGNQVGALLLDYIIISLRENNRLPAEPYAVKSFVSTELAAKIAADNGVKMFNVFTGFKYIGETIKEQEIPGRREFLFGFEESYGYLRGTYARDKDAVVASMLVCEAAGYYKTLGMTLYDAMGALYEKYGYYVDGVDSIYMEGLDGLQRMKDLMASLRKNPPKEFGGDKVTSYIDYAIPAEYDLVKGTSEKLPGGTTDTLYFRIGTDVIVIRPSGTEPKIKFYCLCSGRTMKEAEEKTECYKSSAKALAV